MKKLKQLKLLVSTITWNNLKKIKKMNEIKGTSTKLYRSRVSEKSGSQVESTKTTSTEPKMK